MKDKRRVNVGMIGMGNRSQAWIKSCNTVKSCRIVALCDKIEALTRQRHQMAAGLDKETRIECYTDVERMLKEANIDAVVLVVAPEHNADLICRCLEAGKHVIAEVPLCYTIEECWRIVLAAEKSGLKFQLGEQVRFSAWAQAWKQMVREDTLGKVLYVEGQYLHGMGPDRYWHDAETGERITPEEAKTRKAIKSRTWNMKHTTLYLPHELSPILSILDDRVVKVTGMGNRPKSYRNEWFPRADMEVALMHTAKDTMLRLLTGFTIETLNGTEHCNRMIGVKGWVEQNRMEGQSGKGMLWLADRQMADIANVNWAYKNYWETPPEARASGHGGLDYYPMATFVQAILNDTPTAMDVYKAAEAAAPAILAARSIEQKNACLAVPDFRPGKGRKAGCRPKCKM